MRSETADILTKSCPVRREAGQHPRRILLAEDDPEMRCMLAQILRLTGYEVIECSNGMELLDRLGSFIMDQEQQRIDLVISDIRMPVVTGLEVLEGWQNRAIPPIILITAFGNEELHAKAAEYGVAAMLDKPFELQDLLVTIREVLQGRLPRTSRS